MTTFIVGHFTIHNRDDYAAYRDKFFPVFQRSGGALVAFDDHAEVLEGELPSGRTVILSFPDRAAAKAFWHSDEYQTIAKHRRDGTTTAFIAMIEDHPEPSQFA